MLYHDHWGGQYTCQMFFGQGSQTTLRQAHDLKPLSAYEWSTLYVAITLIRMESVSKLLIHDAYRLTSRVTLLSRPKEGIITCLACLCYSRQFQNNRRKID